MGFPRSSSNTDVVGPILQAACRHARFEPAGIYRSLDAASRVQVSDDIRHALPYLNVLH